MWELRFIAVSADGANVLVTAPDLDHEEFRLPITDELRDAVAPPARPAQPAPSTGSALTPREIQSRIRGGESPEELAQAAGVPLDKVERYAGPVLSERVHVAEEARAARISWQGGHPESPGGSLDQVISARLALEGVDAATVAWDAWRRDDTVWVVQVSYVLGDDRHTAEWSWDPGKRQLRPYGAAARALSSPPPSEPEPAAQPPAVVGLRMVPAPAAAGAARSAAATAPDRPTESPAVEPPAAHTAHTAQAAQAVQAVQAAEAEQPELPELPARPAASSAPSPSSRRRPAVPSWDDILFGAKHTER